MTLSANIAIRAKHGHIAGWHPGRLLLDGGKLRAGGAWFRLYFGTHWPCHLQQIFKIIADAPNAWSTLNADKTGRRNRSLGFQLPVSQGDTEVLGVHTKRSDHDGIVSPAKSLSRQKATNSAGTAP